MIRILRSFLATRSRASLLTLAMLLVAGVGVADYSTGYFLSLGIFYIVPIALLAWYLSRTAGVVSAFASAIIWYFVNSAFAPPQVSQAVVAWNSGVRFGFFVVIATLLSSLRQSYDRQTELARTDPLTGLLNSRAFTEQARIELARAQRSGHQVGVLYLDLDNFKALNDSSGHAAGDSLLAALGSVLRAAVRSSDLVARVGGDEFAVLLSGTTGSLLRASASRLQAAVLGAGKGFSPPVSVTVGALTTDGMEDIESLLRRADHLMYEGKASRRGSVVLAAPPRDA